MSEDEARPRPEEGVLAAAAAERREAPRTPGEAADLADQYDQMMRLAGLFDAVGEEMHDRAALGTDVVADPSFADSAPLSPATHHQAEDDLLAAATGPGGLLSRSTELDADALVLRATVLTYRWIDELQDAAFHTLGAIAGRAVGYLAPEVELGGAILTAGLIETDALDRDGVATYLTELTATHPELLEHVTSGGGGLLDGLQMRAALTLSALADDAGRATASGGLRAIGLDALPADLGSALRDVAGGLVDDPAPTPATGDAEDATAPGGLGDLMAALAASESSVLVHQVGGSRFIAYLPGPGHGGDRRLRLVGGDQQGYAARVVAAVSRAVRGAGAPEGATVMLVGAGHGGAVAAELAARGSFTGWQVDQVVSAGSPRAHVPRLPEGTRMLALEDRRDPVALLGSLVDAPDGRRLTIVYDAGEQDGAGHPWIEGGRTADAASDPRLLAELERLRGLGYLAAPAG